MPTSPLYALVLAGGSGTRFWPASREARPKQFLPISGERPLIVETVARLEGLVPIERVLVVTAASQVGLVQEALPELPPENLIAEPEAKNTAPAILLAALEVDRRAPESVQVVLPADHVIRPVRRFQEALVGAAEEAEASAALVTFGIRPYHPATGYGYIELGAEVARRGELAVHEVTQFVEKPDLERAKGFLRSGKHLWNSGMFVWTTAAILGAYERLLPDVVRALRGASGPDALAEAYAGLSASPVDKAILERHRDVRVLPIDFRWSDVGSWAALPEVHDTDTQGNWPILSNGARLLAEDASGCIVYAESDELIALVGVEDLVVVRAGRTTLVCTRERAQDVKKLVERLKLEKSPHL